MVEMISLVSRGLVESNMAPRVVYFLKKGLSLASERSRIALMPGFE